MMLFGVLRIFIILTLVVPSVYLSGTAYSQQEGAEVARRPAAFTEAEIKRIDELEQEWAVNIDNAVPYIRQKDGLVSTAFLNRANKIIAEIGRLLATKGYDPSSIDRLVAMGRLTDAYMNMARIAGYTGTVQIAVKNASKIKELFDDTRKKVTEARAKFYQVPPLQEVCGEFLEALDEFERDIRKVLSQDPTPTPAS